jgi:hypothetical protein
MDEVGWLGEIDKCSTENADEELQYCGGVFGRMLVQIQAFLITQYLPPG